MKINKAFIGLGIFILSTLIGFAQNTPGLVWATSTGGTDFQSNATSRSIALDNDSNIYITGAFTGTIDLDPSSDDFKLSALGSRDIFIAKYNKQGDFIWGKGIGGTKPDEANAIHVDVLGNVYVTGFFEATVDFDPGTGMKNLASEYSANGVTISYRSAFILKLKDNGNYLWAGRMGFVPFWIDATATGTSVATDDGGNVIIVGTFSGEVDFDPSDAEETRIRGNGQTNGFVAKYDPSGTFSWAKSVGSINGASATDVAVSSSGDILVTGSFRDSTDFDPNNGVYKMGATVDNFNPTYDVFVWALNPNGDFNWAKSMGGNGNDYGTAISLDDQSNIYTVGSFNGDADFDPSPKSIVLSSVLNSSDVFVSKLNSEGDYIWAKTFGGANTDGGYDIAVDSKQQVYSMGFFMESVDFDPGSNQALLTSTFKSVFVSKLDGEGNYLNAYQIDNSGVFTAKSGGIAADNSGNVVVSQDLVDVTDLDPTVCVFNQAPITGTSGFFLQKVNPSVKSSCPVDTLISIIKQPTNIKPCVNDTATCSIIASGSSTLKYQWQKYNSFYFRYDDMLDTGGFSGTTTAILSISNASFAMNGTYRCRLYDGTTPDVFSSTVSLSSQSPPSYVTVLTKDTSVCTNTLSLKVQGASQYQYKWRFANPTGIDTLKIINEKITGSANSSLVTIETLVSNYKVGDSKLYLTTKNAAGCTRLDSATLRYFPDAKPVLSSGLVKGDSVLLTAQSNVSGTWSVAKGEASIRNMKANSTYAKLFVFGEYKFVYTSSNSCKTNDTITVFRTNSTVPTDSAKAGDDVYACSSNAILAATKPTKTGFKGKWTIEKGSLKIENDTLYNSPITGINDSLSVLVWTVQNVNTQVSTSDKVRVFRTKVQITEPGLTDTVFVPSRTFIINAKIEPFGSHVWYVNNLLQDNAPLRSNAGLPKDTSVFKIITNIVDCELTDTVVVIFKDTRVKTEAGLDRNTCSDTATLAATSVPQGYAGVWRSSNPKVKFSDSTKVNAKAIGLELGQNKLYWLAKLGNTVQGRDSVIITRDTLPSAIIPTYYNVCLADTILPAQLNQGESIVWKVIAGGATIDFPTQPKSRIIGLKKFSPKTKQYFNELEWTVTKGTCTIKDTLPIYFADSITVDELSKEGLAGDTIKVLASQNSIFSKGDRFDSVFVVPISSSNTKLILNRYSKNDTIFFVTNRKLKGDATYTYSLRNTCGATSNIATLSVNAINVQPNTKTIPLLSQTENKFVYTMKVRDIDPNNFIIKAEAKLPLPNGVVATANINSDTTEVTFTIDFTNAKENAETSYSVSFRLFDGEKEGEIRFIIPTNNNLGLVIYNAVSPNGDGKHDIFEIEGIEQEIYKNNKVEIFNRWGDRVYKQSGYNNKDVAFDGGTLPDGTYYYLLDLGNDRKLLKGFLLLSR